MDKDLSISSDGPPSRYLDRAEVLIATVQQLRKDLALSDEALMIPPSNNEAFEHLRGRIETELRDLDVKGRDALRIAMYRVDIPEIHFLRTLTAGGLHALAGEVVLRALQKVLTRLRYAGRF